MAKYSRKPNATERAVTRAMSKKDPSLAPKQEKEPQKPKPINKRQYTTPWCNIVMREVMAKFPTITRKAAQRKVRRIIREAKEWEKARWRRLAVLPPKRTRCESSETEEEEEEEVDEETQHKRFSDSSSIDDGKDECSFDDDMMSTSHESHAKVSKESERFSDASTASTEADEPAVVSAAAHPQVSYAQTIDELMEQALWIKEAFQHLDQIKLDVNFSLNRKANSVPKAETHASEDVGQLAKKKSVNCIRKVE